MLEKKAFSLKNLLSNEITQTFMQNLNSFCRLRENAPLANQNNHVNTATPVNVYRIQIHDDFVKFPVRNSEIFPPNLEKVSLDPKITIQCDFLAERKLEKIILHKSISELKEDQILPFNVTLNFTNAFKSIGKFSANICLTDVKKSFAAVIDCQTLNLDSKIITLVFNSLRFNQVINSSKSYKSSNTEKTIENLKDRVNIFSLFFTVDNVDHIYKSEILLAKKRAFQTGGPLLKLTQLDQITKFQNFLKTLKADLQPINLPFAPQRMERLNAENDEPATPPVLFSAGIHPEIELIQPAPALSQVLITPLAHRGPPPPLAGKRVGEQKENPSIKRVKK